MIYYKVRANRESNLSDFEGFVEIILRAKQRRQIYEKYILHILWSVFQALPHAIQRFATVAYHAPIK